MTMQFGFYISNAVIFTKKGSDYTIDLYCSLWKIMRNPKPMQILGFLTPKFDEYECLNVLYRTLTQIIYIHTKSLKNSHPNTINLATT